jgi:hypothetical protein
MSAPPLKLVALAAIRPPLLMSEAPLVGHYYSLHLDTRTLLAAQTGRKLDGRIFIADHGLTSSERAQHLRAAVEMLTCSTTDLLRGRVVEVWAEEKRVFSFDPFGA